MAGQVLVDGRRVDKPGTLVPADARLEVKGRHRYVSRGGYKLAAALDHFGTRVGGRVALDCGASTGGFTDCLLQRGAALVYAVDVGFGQLAGSLRANPRVQTLERTNLGDLRLRQLDPRPDLVTLDLSYLSLTAALPLAAELLARGGDVLALFKPLFEIDDAEARRTGRAPQATTIVAALQQVLVSGRAVGLAVRGAAKLALRPRHGVSEYFLSFSLDRYLPDRRFDEAALMAAVAEPGIGSDTEAAEHERSAFDDSR
jgi:23S rRNA (cytidine1920-2'-O)/16S rRNA (cytidine1409-2'-O)-methyltransferase